MNAESATPNADFAARAVGPDDEILDVVASRAAAWATAQGGLLVLEMDATGRRGSLLDRVGARLPARCRWMRTRAPQTAADVAFAILDVDVVEPTRVADDIECAVREAAEANELTVLAINDADDASGEVLELIARLAGLEPSLQIILVGTDTFLPAGGDPDDLGGRVKRRMAVATTGAPTGAELESFGGAPDLSTVEAPTEVAAPAFAGPVEVAPAHPATGPTQLPTDLGGQAEPDPFRNAPTGLSLDSPALLPVLSAPHSAHAEWFRILRLRLEDWVRRTGGGSKTLLVTGPDVAVGKSFVSVNLALLWAQSTGQRVLLVDGDLRRPQFHAVFEIPRRPGFADVLSGRNRLDECNAFVSEVGLHVMSAGRPGNPRHLVNPDRVQAAFDAMRSSFDLVVVDSPPLSGMVDGRSMAAGADGVLMVVHSGATRFQSLQKALDFLPSDNLVGAVVNAGAVDAESAYDKYRRAAGG